MLVAALLRSQAHAQALSLTVSEALRGELVTLTASGATPGEAVYFAYSGRTGAGPCPPQLGGLCVDLLAPTLIGTRLADAAGEASLVVRVPANAPLMDLHVQAAHGGATPEKAPTVVVPVLWELTGPQGGWYAISDAATLNDAGHLRRIVGDVTLRINSGAPYNGRLDLPYLESTGGSVRADPGADLELTAPVLASAGSVVLIDVTDARFPALVSASGEIGVFDCQVDCVASFPLLTSALSLRVAGTVGSTSLEAPALQSVLERFVVSGNAGPVAVGFDNLTSVGSQYGDMTIGGNSGIASIDGWFPRLTSIGSDGLFIYDNDVLTSITSFGAPAGVAVTEVHVTNNPVLTTISGLSGITGGPSVNISSNPSLPSCNVAATSLAMGTPQPTCGYNLEDSCSDGVGNDVCR